MEVETMIRNAVGWDRVARVLLGTLGLSMLIAGPKSLWGLLGLVPLMTGLAGYCPLYQLLGLNTCALKAPRKTLPE
jgi:hypothetical protein